MKTFRIVSMTFRHPDYVFGGNALRAIRRGFADNEEGEIKAREWVQDMEARKLDAEKAARVFFHEFTPVASDFECVGIKNSYVEIEE